MKQKHGMHQRKIYRVWVNYKQRCGIKGITVLWPTFKEFWRDKGKEYKPGRLLSVNGEWLTRKELKQRSWITRKANKPQAKQRTLTLSATEFRALEAVSESPEDYVREAAYEKFLSQVPLRTDLELMKAFNPLARRHDKIR